MLQMNSGARGRSDSSALNQRFGLVQPSLLTDAIPPSPARHLSNLFERDSVLWNRIGRLLLLAAFVLLIAGPVTSALVYSTWRARR